MCKYLTRFFDLAAVRAAMMTPPTDPQDASMHNQRSYDWDLDVGYDGAAHLLTHGWPEGVAIMQQMQAETPPQAFDAVAQWRLDYAGQRPCIPAFLGGDMRAMYRRGADIIPRKLLKLGFVVSGSHKITAPDLMGRAVAYCELIQQLEQSGVDVEVYAVDMAGRRARSNSRVRDIVAVQAIHYLIKPAGQHIQPDIFLGTIGHPAFFRRCMFRMSEVYSRDFFNGHPYPFRYGRAVKARQCREALAADIQYYEIDPASLDDARRAIEQSTPFSGGITQ